MIEFYTLPYAQRQLSSYRKWLMICVAAMLAALAVCITLCCFVDTGTARDLYIAVSGVSIAAGWTYLLFLRPKRRAFLTEYRHSENLLKKSDDEQFHRGIISVSATQTQIPGSIRVRTVKLTNGEETGYYHLNARFSLPANGTFVVLRCVNNYVCAYEVISDA